MTVNPPLTQQFPTLGTGTVAITKKGSGEVGIHHEDSTDIAEKTVKMIMTVAEVAGGLMGVAAEVVAVVGVGRTPTTKSKSTLRLRLL